MIDYTKQLVEALNTVLPTHYELVLHSGMKVPCISYMETNNFVSEDGDTLGYSRITYQVKVWANKVADIQKYSLLVDKVLRPLGWKRTAAGELYEINSTMIQKIMTYEALIKEDF